MHIKHKIRQEIKLEISDNLKKEIYVIILKHVVKCRAAGYHATDF